MQPLIHKLDDSDLISEGEDGQELGNHLKYTQMVSLKHLCLVYIVTQPPPSESKLDGTELMSKSEDRHELGNLATDSVCHKHDLKVITHCYSCYCVATQPLLPQHVFDDSELLSGAGKEQGNLATENSEINPCVVT